ncbi:hypothetical protein FJZ21_00545 [Candidatus Pacearchaeota archaeon]|nr:hypothetical protein [Candidatus Pacearchaeota archaeon]
MIKIIGFVVIMIIVYSAGAFALYEAGKYFDNKMDNEIDGLDECINEGYSVIQIYPRVCVDKFGNNYIEEIAKE